MKKIVKRLKLTEESPKGDLAYWRSRPSEERIEAVETLRKEHYGNTPRLQGIVRIIKQAQS